MVRTDTALLLVFMDNSCQCITFIFIFQFSHVEIILMPTGYMTAVFKQLTLQEKNLDVWSQPFGDIF